MSVLALIPARSGSKGVVRKNWRCLGGRTLIAHAVACAREAGCERVVVSSNQPLEWRMNATGMPSNFMPSVEEQPFIRPADLAQDDTPMLAVVQHALAQVPGPEDQIIVLLQPTQPFRTPAHVRAAITLLQETQADSVVSVVELPKTHSPEMVCRIGEGTARLWPYLSAAWSTRPACRQAVSRPVYKPDGTCYVFRRSTVSCYGSIYGDDVRPLIIPAYESCELDTEQDWADVEARWKAQHG